MRKWVLWVLALVAGASVGLAVGWGVPAFLYLGKSGWDRLPGEVTAYVLRWFTVPFGLVIGLFVVVVGYPWPDE